MQFLLEQLSHRLDIEMCRALNDENQISVTSQEDKKYYVYISVIYTLTDCKHNTLFNLYISVRSLKCKRHRVII